MGEHDMAWHLLAEAYDRLEACRSCAPCRRFWRWMEAHKAEALAALAASDSRDHG